MSDKDEVQRFTELQTKIKDLSDNRIRVEEKYKNEREKLEALLKEIADKGYDPTKLAEIKATKEAELKKSLEELEKTVEEVSTKLSAIEEPTNA